MRKTFLKISNVLLTIFMILLALLSVSAFVLALVGKSFPTFDFVDWVYLTFGFVFAPIEYILCGSVGHLIPDAFSIIVMGVSAIVFILSIILIKFKLKSTREEEYRRNFYKKMTYILSILSLIIFVLNLIVLLKNFKNVNNYLNSAVPLISKIIEGKLLIITYISLTSLGIFVMLFGIFATVFYRKVTAKAVKIYGTINFYSKEFEEQQNDVQVKNTEEQEEIEATGIKEQSAEAKDLVLKIMQLEELRKSGQINNVEYTKLRQKAIRRYKK